MHRGELAPTHVPKLWDNVDSMRNERSTDAQRSAWAGESWGPTSTWTVVPVPVRGQLDKDRIQADLNALYEDLLIQRQPDDLDGARTQLRSFLAETADDWFQTFLPRRIWRRTGWAAAWRMAVLFQFEQGMDGWVEDGGSRDFSKGTALFAWHLGHLCWRCCRALNRW